MKTNYPSKFSVITQWNDNQRILTKRDFMRMILDGQVKVHHKFEDEIVRRKICIGNIHGSGKKIHTKNNKIKDFTKFNSYKSAEILPQRRLTLNLQAPSIIGTKSMMFIKDDSPLKTNYRSHSNCFTRGTMRLQAKSSMNLRSTSVGEKKQCFKIRSVYQRNQSVNNSPSRFTQTPKEWQIEHLRSDMRMYSPLKSEKESY